MNSKVKPFISVIIPVYKTELYIGKTIQSLVSQTFKDFEVILVDDETPDSAIDKAEYKLLQNNISFTTIHQKNSGQGVSRNNGVKHVKGEWFLFLDSDDILQHDTFELMKNAVSSSRDVNFIFTDYQRVSLGDEFKKAKSINGVISFEKDAIQDEFLIRNQVILAPGTLFNKKWYLSKSLLFKKIPYSEDQLFIWELLLEADKALKIQKTLYNYLQRPGSIMSASKYTEIIMGYSEYKNLQEKYICSEKSTELTKKYLLSRWVIGILHSGAKLISKNEYKQLFENLEARKHSKNMLGFSSIKMKIIAFMLLFFPSITYWIFRKF
ncbi:glycosyltransferase family 2 protein [Flavobacterium sp.]|uniref:glycosyltransferase family 2 protein n=1 Tax=Flavobacterium sp. TaxID=239 RepID=UPI001B6DBD71|nr:glycosyltransferase family 2 protein [Flavobacterium sp.]MBP6182587.1 glycosyltransferase family 2 protein [Flavobacterium sp.]